MTEELDRFIKQIDNKIYLREKAIELIEFLSIETDMSFSTSILFQFLLGCVGAVGS